MIIIAKKSMLKKLEGRININVTKQVATVLLKMTQNQ
jgi:hypothetical protein